MIRHLRRSAPAAALTALLLLPAAHAVAAPRPSAAAARIAVADYDLGDAAFHVAGFHPVVDDRPDASRLAPIELRGRVHWPLGGGAHPLAVLVHGDWSTCADAAAQAELDGLQRQLDAVRGDDDAAQTERDRLQTAMEAPAGRLDAWPCAAGTHPIDSYRGLDWLAAALARAGFVAVSISADGVNAGELGDAADTARARLIDRHLAMWASLDRSGSGPLAARLRGAHGTAVPASAFRGRIDLGRTVLVGHSRGGRAVFRAASAVDRGHLPRGVRIRAVAGLAPADLLAHLGGPSQRDYLVRGVPILQWFGTCDGLGASDYLRLGLGRTGAPMTQVVATGAHHDFLNTAWSPSGGQVGATDDAHWLGEGPAGRCTGSPVSPVLRGDPAPVWGKQWGVRQLTEAQERRAATVVVRGFLLRSLRAAVPTAAAVGHRWQHPVPGLPIRERVIGPGDR